MMTNTSLLQQRISLGVRTLRLPFFTATLIPVVLGAVIAWHDGYFHWGYFILAFLGVFFGHVGLNVDNDYRDHLSGDDAGNTNLTPFSGGSRVIQNGEVSPRAIHLISMSGFVLCALIGLVLAYARGWQIFVIGLLAGALIYFYSGKLAYIGYGLGEFATFAAGGPLLVGGAYFVQAQTFTPGVWLVSLTVGLAMANILWINEFPDYEADKAAGKNTMIVILGQRRAVFGFIALWILTYAPIILGVLMGAIPWLALIVLLTLPLAYKAIQTARAYYDDTPRLLPANAATIQLHPLISVLLMVAYAADKFI